MMDIRAKTFVHLSTRPNSHRNTFAPLEGAEWTVPQDKDSSSRSGAKQAGLEGRESPWPAASFRGSVGCRAALKDGSCCAGESGVLSRALFTGASHQTSALCQAPETAEDETYMSLPSGSLHPAGCVFSGLLRGRRQDPEEG